MTTPTEPAQRFSPAELALLAQTADALTAYLGKPILAEVGAAETGCEWAAYARALAPAETLGEDDVRMQMGGPGARWLGNVGGLNPAQTYDCVYLWGIQITGSPTGQDARFVKLDHVGDEYGSADDLAELLPFAFGEGDADDAHDAAAADDAAADP